MKKTLRIISILLVMATVFLLGSCGKAEKPAAEETTTSIEREIKTKVAVLDGPTGIGLSKFKSDRSYAYDVEFYSDPQTIVPLVVSGEVDIACLPLNLAANLYNKTNKNIEMLAINCLGVLHIVTKEENIKNLSDLKGKKIYSTGQGATPEYVLNYLLRKNDVDPEKDVQIEYLSAHNELATKAIEGSVDVCVLPEPFATNVVLSNEKYSKSIDLTTEWSKVCDTQLAMGCIVARKEFISENSDIISEFLDFAEISINFIKDSTGSPNFLISNGYFSDYNFALEAVSGCNLTFITGKDLAKIAFENFNVLYEANPSSVGGQVPDENFYYVP